MFKFFFLIVTACLCASAQEWCELESCQDREHLDCKMGNGKFGDACPDDVVMLNLANAQTPILNKINTFRNRVAGGLLPGKFAATRMATVNWSVPLANLGRRSVKKCTFEQDACVNTNNFDYVGQNIARAVYPKTDTRTNLEIILELIDLWFKEHEKTTMADIRAFPEPTAEGETIANFCQLVRDYSNSLGCGALTFTQENNKVLLLTCNFNLANVLGWPIYDDGPNAKKCVTGRNPNYPYLCSTSEVYNVNNFDTDNHY